MGKKYIIEIEDEPLVRKSALHGETAVYRAKGFNSLVFDQDGLNKLEEYKEDKEIDRENEFSVGDEVRTFSEFFENHTYVIVRVYYDTGAVEVLDKNGCYHWIKTEGIYKTGVHYSAINEVLDRLI